MLMTERNIKNEDRAFMLWNFLGTFEISAIRTLFGGQGQETHTCFGLQESVGFCDYVISLHYVCECECECLGIRQDHQFTLLCPRADCNDA